jgi:hypothetical protein
VATAFVAVGDLRTFIDDQTLDDARAQLLLDAVSDEIRDAVGWSITQEEDQVATLDGRGDHMLLLPTLRLTSVASIVEDGQTLTVGDDYLVYTDGRLARMSGGRPARWTTTRQGVVVTYTHGYPAAAVPGVIKLITLEQAVRTADNPGGKLKSRTINKVAVTYAEMRQMVLPVDDSRLDRYRMPDRGFA